MDFTKLLKGVNEAMRPSPKKRQKMMITASKATNKQPNNNDMKTIVKSEVIKQMYKQQVAFNKERLKIEKLNKKIEKRQELIDKKTKLIQKHQDQLTAYIEQQGIDEQARKDANDDAIAIKEQIGRLAVSDNYKEVENEMGFVVVNDSLQKLQDDELWAKIEVLERGQINLQRTKYLKFVLNQLIAVRDDELTYPKAIQEEKDNEQDDNTKTDSEDEDSSLDEDDVTDVLDEDDVTDLFAQAVVQ